MHDNDYFVTPRYEMTLTNIIFTKTRDYENVGGRNFEISGDEMDYNSLISIIENNSNKLNPVTSVDVANETPGIMKLSDIANPVNIANGWDTTRMRFILEVENVLSSDSWETYYIQGYTDYEDNTMSNRIDPDMACNINSIVVTKSVIHPQTRVPQTTLAASYNIVVDNYGRVDVVNMGMDLNNQKALMRPKDIFDSMDNMTPDQLMYNDDDVSLLDMRGRLTLSPQTSDRGNLSMSNYMSKTINSLSEASHLKNNNDDGGFINAYSYAAGIVGEQPLSSNKFIYALSMHCGEINPIEFTLNDLQAIFGDINEDKVMYVNNTSQAILDSGASIYGNDAGDNLMVPSVYASTATTILETVSSFMYRENITILGFSITNMVVRGEPFAYAITTASSILRGIDISINVERIMLNVKLTLMPMITQRNSIGISIEGYIDSYGDSTISIAFENNEHYVYRFPSFCDSLYVPVISNIDDKEAFVNDLSSILEVVSNEPHTTSYNEGEYSNNSSIITYR